MIGTGTEKANDGNCGNGGGGADLRPSSPKVLACLFFAALLLITFTVDLGSARFLGSQSSEDVESKGSLSDSDSDSDSSGGPGRRCLGLGDDEEMDEMLSKYEMVYLLTPMKAGSSTVRQLDRNCLKLLPQEEFVNSRLRQSTTMQDFISREKEVPPFVTSRISDSQTFVDTLQNSIRSSLIIYVHREETSRFRSGIGEVLHRDYSDMEIIEEEMLLDMIKKGNGEIGTSGLMILNCELYETIADTGANVVFLHYKSLDGLLRLLSKHHCPDYEIARANAFEKPKKMVRVTRKYFNKATGTFKDKKETVELNDWLDSKVNLLEHAFKKRDMASCQGETRKMEDALWSCPDETLFYSSHEFPS